ncbi:MAG: chemotaxis response regulator protein-glutamate methylesterase [Desulfovibrionales bacterium]
MITVLVVDDSAFMRKAISTMLGRDPQIEVVAIARNGEEALEKIRLHNPDVVTMDIEMPKMDGLTALRRVMMESPRPVIMVSSLTSEGAEATLRAMELGAVDFIPKQLSKVSLEIIKIEESLRAKVKAVAHRRFRASAQRRFSTASPEVKKKFTKPRVGTRPARDLVGIGVSTGGPPAVQKLLSGLSKDFPVPIVIAQHMPQAFTGPFARRLDAISSLAVKEAENGERLKNGTVYIAPGGQHTRLIQRMSHIAVEISSEPRDALYRPSASVLLHSLAECVGGRGLGLILTGMGNDGLEGIQVLKKRGGRVIAQSDATCVVYGMPKAIVDAGLADEIVDIEDMAAALVENIYR